MAYRKLLGLSIFFFVLLAISYTLTAVPAAHALKMINDFYIVNSSTLNSISGTSQGGSNKLDITVGETGAGFYSGPNYKIRAGFEYMHNTITFSFTIIGSQIDFGSLDPGTPVTRTNQLVISNGSAYGYQLTAQENHPLLQPGAGAFIPDTACNNGLCTSTNAQIWNSPLTYGFGYNCTNIVGTDCSSDFVDGTYYRPFAASPSAAVVMSSTNVGRNHTAQITYQVNVAGTQATGLYQNYITYIATPKF